MRGFFYFLEIYLSNPTNFHIRRYYCHSVAYAAFLVMYTYICLVRTPSSPSAAEAYVAACQVKSRKQDQTWSYGPELIVGDLCKGGGDASL